MENQKFCLKWDGFQTSVTSVFDALRQDEELVDITLCCEGQRVKAHRMMLSACSPYFRDILKNNACQQMVIFLRDTSAADLHSIVEFMYKGCVNVSQAQLASFIKTAEMLQIKGLSGEDDKSAGAPPQRPGHPPPSPQRPGPPPPPSPQRPVRRPSPPAKRRRTSNLDLSEVTSQPPTPLPPSADNPRSSDQHLPAAAAGGGPSLSPAQLQPLKVEKLEADDVTEQDDDVISLDATLGYVAELEGGDRYQETAEGMAAGGAQEAAIAAMGGLAGPSHPLPEDGSTQGGGYFSPGGDRHLVAESGGHLVSDGGGGHFACSICGRVYQTFVSRLNHMKQHQGLTRCPLCGKTFSIVPSLRIHMRSVHKMSADQVYRLVPKRKFN